MTRYSRSVIPGRAGEAQDPNLERMVFGAKRRPPAAANDAAEPDFLPSIDDDEADMFVKNANSDRRTPVDRRNGQNDRRGNTNGRRVAEYAPLRNDRGGRPADDSKRGPLLLAGALLIVVVFAVVVWNAYSDGVAGDEAEVAPELSTAGTFKTPPRVIEAAPVVAEPTEVVAIDALDGAEATASAEERPTPPPVEAAVTPPPSKVMAPPPAPLKAPPQQAAVTPPAVKPAPAKVETAKVEPPKPTPAPAKPAAATPAPAPVATAAAPGAYKPAFAAYGDHVVQIAATSSTATAESEWARMSKASPELLSGAERFIQEADVNGKTVYRLRVGSFASKADAAAFCTAFKAKGGNCYPAVK
jgi:outer membrane biosynthesis protein TonB